MAEEPAGGAATEVIPASSLMDLSTNWVVAAGSLEQSVAFDTSSSFVSDDPDGGGGVSNAKGAVFLRASSGESDPCEIHICFRQKHDIHRVYVRSTARVYEIYHSLELPLQNNEYLCTVRCGEASTEVLLPEIDEERLPMEEHTIHQASVDVPETLATGASTNGSDEDGWIEVKVPDSTMVTDKNEIPTKNFAPKRIRKAQTCYEATAEISDHSPLMSLTLRLLSLQPKGQVYIEEIYIYADPFESEISSSIPATSLASNLGGASLLSMLVPGLLQLSKSGNSRLKDKGISDGHENNTVEETEKTNPDIRREILKEEENDTMEQTEKITPDIPGLLQLSKSGNSRLKDKGISDGHQNNTVEETEKTNPDIQRKILKEEENDTMEQTEKINPDIGREVLKKAYFTEKNFIRVQEEPPIQFSPGNANSGSCKEVPTDHMYKSFHDLNSLPSSRTEKLLEELLSRVGRIETFCSSFEEKMVKPVFSIEKRLQKVEQQLAVLTERNNCSKPPGPSIISAPEFTCDESEFVNGDHDVLETPEQNCRFEMTRSPHLDSCKMCPGLVVRAPEFVQDDTPCCSNSSSYIRENVSEDKKSSCVMAESDQDSETDSIFEGTKDLKKERNTEDKASIFSAPDFSSEDDSHTGNSASAPTERSCWKDRSTFSIDTALASALEALLSSTTKSPGRNHPLDPQESSPEDGKNNIHAGREVPPGNAESSNAFHTVAGKKGSSLEDNESLGVFQVEKSMKNETLEFISDTSSPQKEIDAQDTNGDFIGENVDQSEENRRSSAATASKLQNEDWHSAAMRDWHFTFEASNAQNDYQPRMGNISETRDNQLPSMFHKDTGSMSKEAPTFGLNIGGSFADSDTEEADHHESKRRWLGESTTESIAEGLNADSCHVGWNDLSSSDSEEIKFPSPSWLTGKGSECDTESENLERVAVGSYHSDAASDSSSSNFASPRVGVEPGNGLKSSPDVQQLIPDFEASPDRNQTSDSLFKDLLREMSNIKVQASECKDDARETEGGLLNSPQYFTGCCSSSPPTDQQPLINMEEGFQNDVSARQSCTDAKQPLVDVDEMVSIIKTSGVEQQEQSRSVHPDQQPFFSSLI